MMDDQDNDDAMEASDNADATEKSDDEAAVDVQVNVDAAMQASARVIEIDAANFAFSPMQVSVKKGEKVTLRLRSNDGNHGMAIPGLGINTVISEGKTVDIELPTDAAGNFAFRCSVPCGPGHKEMTGTITIE